MKQDFFQAPVKHSGRKNTSQDIIQILNLKEAK